MTPWPLVGRDAELALFEQLVLGDRRGIVLVAPAGTGKTRLVHETMRRLERVAATETIAATRSAQSLPLASVAALLPEQTPAATEPLDLFRAVRRTLAARAGERPLVVAIDDAHLLDPLSAALVHHLALAGSVRFLIAIRSGEPVEDAITALWRDGIHERVDMQPLGPDDVTSLLRAVLGGDVEAASAWRLWRITGGNPLYLREIVTEAQRAATLVDVAGVWQWRGAVRVGVRLREIVEARLAGLDVAERAVVALLAVGERVAAGTVESVCDPNALAALERRGFVVAEPDGGRDRPAVYRLDHPLFAEAIRRSMPATERGRWCRVLADAAETTAPDDTSLLQLTMWQLDGGLPIDASTLTYASERASARFDGALGERLADAAVDAGADDSARLVRAEARLLQGRYADALDDAHAVTSVVFDDASLARLATVIAQAGFWGLGLVQETEDALQKIAGHVESIAARQRVLALESAMQLAAGRLPVAAELGLSIASDPAADALARLRAVTAAAAGLSLRGHPDQALALCEELLPVALAHTDALPRGPGWVLAQTLFGLSCLGRFDGIAQLLTPFREAAMAEGDEEVVHSGGVVIVRLALTAGDLEGARAAARETAAALRRYDPAGYLPWCLGMLAQSAAQMGDVAGAQEAVAELDDLTWVVRLNDHDVAIGRAWAAAAAGEVTRPLAILFEAAGVARAAGNVFSEGLLLYEALRIGAHTRDLVDRLDACRAGGRLPVHEMFHARAVASAANDGVALD
ncbi:MAG TPA: AAA family ATPase, partial [Acidimicrobiia bacterium]|nr:AAA family ATPase [Acidimicrobiia bacterium]